MFLDNICFSYVVVKNWVVVDRKKYAYLSQCVKCSQDRIRKILNENNVPIKVKREIYNSYEFKCGCCYYFAPQFYIRIEN